MKRTIVPKKKWQELTDEELGGKRENTVCVVRYGGFGDALQISSIFPLLKKQGYNVCVNATEGSKEILSHDPNIDELLIQDTGQIPNEELGPYWERITPLFDKFINLGGVIEQTLLCLEGQDIYTWSHDKRHSELDVNYGEALHDKAEVGHIFRPKFYPSKLEKKWVKRQRKEMKLAPHKFVVLIALSGSAVHKAYPHMDAVMANLLIRWPHVRFVMVGDDFCKMLESGWEKEKRVFLKSGEWSIRNTLAFAQTVDLVLGPETGVLNAVSAEDIAKVVLLSHSSRENLTKHWVNTTSLIPEDVDCYPCHKMHYGFKTCNRDPKTGGSLCAANIDPRKVVDSIVFHRKLKNDISGTLSNR